MRKRDLLGRLFFLVLSLGYSAQVKAQTSPEVLEQAATSSVREDMDAVYVAFRELQKYIFSRKQFLDPSNDAPISSELKVLQTRFHRVGMKQTTVTADPGFQSTLKILKDMLDDAGNRFKEGNKEYALWRLKTAANYCVTCHTRHEVKVDFYDSDPGLSGLSKQELGEFYLATRQFEKARSMFLAAVYEPSPGYVRIEALRKWLIIYTRVYPDAGGALSDLNRVRAKLKFSGYEDQELQGWLASLRRWKSERKSKVTPLEQAKALINQGLALDQSPSGRLGAIEILRGTRLLHELLDVKPSKPQAALDNNQRREALYYLGLAYSELPNFFLNELPELFLEQCIRDFPGSDEAKKSYELYKEIVTLGYTGSGGVRVPDDVLLSFKELHDLAYAVVNSDNSGRV